MVTLPKLFASGFAHALVLIPEGPLQGLPRDLSSEPAEGTHDLVAHQTLRVAQAQDESRYRGRLTENSQRPGRLEAHPPVGISQELRHRAGPRGRRRPELAQREQGRPAVGLARDRLHGPGIS